MKKKGGNSYDSGFPKIKTQFTEEEIEELKAKYPKVFSVLEKVKVEEHEQNS